MNTKELSMGLADAVERAAAGVVRVEGRRRPSSGLTGFGDGIVVTAAHTLHRDAGLVVGLSDGDTRPAALVGIDPGTDVAVLRIDGAAPTPTWRDGDPRVGELVLALGRPNGGIRATLGIVSFVGGARQTAHGGRLDRWLEVDGSLPPGFSGGPLVDGEGAVLGMNTSAIGRGGGTVPLTTLRRVVDAIVAHGGVRRGWLGIGVQPAGLTGARAVASGRDAGLLVTALAPGGPAEAGGVLLGDIVVAFDGAPVTDAGELLTLLDGATVDAPVPVRLVRGDTVIELPITVGGRVAQARRGCGR